MAVLHFQSVEPSEVKHAPPASGPASVTAEPPSTGKEIDPDSIPTAIKYQDDNSLAHPNVRPLNLMSLLRVTQAVPLYSDPWEDMQERVPGFSLLQMGSWPQAVGLLMYIRVWCCLHVSCLLE